jgi:hypothetical protein
MPTGLARSRPPELLLQGAVLDQTNVGRTIWLWQSVVGMNTFGSLFIRDFLSAEMETTNAKACVSLEFAATRRLFGAGDSLTYGGG